MLRKGLLDLEEQLYYLKSQSEDASGGRHVFSEPFGFGSHKPEYLRLWTVSHSFLEQGLQRLPDRYMQETRNHLNRIIK